MAAKKPQEMTNEELLKSEKAFKVLTYMLIGFVIMLLLVGLVLMIKKKGFNAVMIIPVTLVPIIIINANSLKAVQQEMKNRNLR